MNYREAVEKKLVGEMEEVTRLKEIWGEIVNAFEEGGEDSIKLVLNTRMEKINKKFKELLEQLRNKL